MRIRNVKNKNEIIEKSKLYVKNPKEYRGNWNKLFDNNNPIHIEIGMGKGNFIIEIAKKNKSINYIGIEKEDSIICRAIEKEEDLENLRFVLFDADKIDKLFDKEIDRIYLNFSDPWPKKRHEKRRLTSLSFLQKYEKVFKGYNEIYLKTDNKGLFSFSIESLNNYGYQLKNVTLNLEQSSDNIETEYETKFRSQGITINRLEAYKNNLNYNLSIICNNKEEFNSLINLYNLEKDNDIFNIYYGKYENKNILVAYSGIGKANSSMLTQHIIDKYNPSLIISTGTCTILNDTIKNMDFIIASILTYHDFEPFNLMKNNVGINGLIDQDQDIIIKISDIIKKYKYEVVEVPMCSGDNFINDNEKENEIKNTTNCYAVDMDCASIAHVCNKNNVLSVIIREINNNDNIVKSCRVIEKIVDSL